MTGMVDPDLRMAFQSQNCQENNWNMEGFRCLIHMHIFFGFQKATRNFTKSNVESDIARNQVSEFDAPYQCFFLGCNDQIYIVDCERSIIPCLSPSPRDLDQTCNELKLVL